MTPLWEIMSFLMWPKSQMQMYLPQDPGLDYLELPVILGYGVGFFEEKF